ncbi:MAG TPA: hypothetical protein ENN64_01215 [bacterium]|nr:hypothetical protein [bacterium]
MQYLSEHFAESSNDYKVIDKENSDLEIESGKITLRNAEKNKTLIYYVENNSLYVNRNNSINSITVPGIRVEKFLLTPIMNSDDEIIGVEINTTLDNGIVKENIKYTYLSYEI